MLHLVLHGAIMLPFDFMGVELGQHVQVRVEFEDVRE